MAIFVLQFEVPGGAAILVRESGDGRDPGRLCAGVDPRRGWALLDHRSPQCDYQGLLLTRLLVNDSAVGWWCGAGPAGTLHCAIRLLQSLPPDPAEHDL